MTYGLHPKSTLQREKHYELINQNKTTRRAGYKTVDDTPHPHRPPRKHSELKEPDEILKKATTLTTIARQKTAKEKALQ